LQVADGALVAAGAVLGGSAGLAAVSAVITAHEASAVKLLEDLKVVVEANQARRKPKVRKFDDFEPSQVVWCGQVWLVLFRKNS
jgi:hypothetical protein